MGMTYDEIRAIEMPDGSIATTTNRQITCDGTPRGKRERVAAHWIGDVHHDMSGLTIGDVIDIATAEFMVKWAAVVRDDIPANIPNHRTATETAWAIPSPSNRGRTRRQPTTAQLDARLESMSADDIAAMMARINARNTDDDTNE